MTHIGGRFSHAHRFHDNGFVSRHDLRRFDGPRFSSHGYRPSNSNGDENVLKDVVITSDRTVQCWIPKIYLTNSNTKPSAHLSLSI